MLNYGVSVRKCMNKLDEISLDTNIFIFGLRNIDLFSSLILKNLFLFNVKISAQIEKEVRQNLTLYEIHKFYRQISLLSKFEIVCNPLDDNLVDKYRQLGLKTGDAKIAAFCEQEHIQIFVSENRHFLEKLSERPCFIADSKTFCKIFCLSK